jgi:hypothetical protein
MKDFTGEAFFLAKAAETKIPNTARELIKAYLKSAYREGMKDACKMVDEACVQPEDDKGEWIEISRSEREFIKRKIQSLET